MDVSSSRPADHWGTGEEAVGSPLRLLLGMLVGCEPCPTAGIAVRQALGGTEIISLLIRFGRAGRFNSIIVSTVIVVTVALILVVRSHTGNTNGL